MIAVDTSALLAILWLEPEAADCIRCISTASSCCLSAVSLQEAATVLAGRSGDARGWPALDELIARSEIDTVPHDRTLALIARDAFLRFGKGRHKAALNLGDCAAYALAKSRGVPLLFKGGDFTRTDIIPALPA